MISVLDMFKIGIGPSSSHTVGPMRAGKQFIDELIQDNLLHKVSQISVELYGSLAMTGKGHYTDTATIMGLAGATPESVEPEAIPAFIADVEQRQRLPLANGQHEVAFPREEGVVFRFENLPLHENGMRFIAMGEKALIRSQIWYSIGGGFIVDEAHFDQPPGIQTDVSWPFHSAAELLAYCRESQLPVSGIVMQNELSSHSEQQIKRYFIAIWQAMQACIQKGITAEGVLPGPLRVPRRAPALYRQLTSSDLNQEDPMNVIDWVNLFALAINEENAAGGRVVTAPTNGACGIVPAVLAYYNRFITPATEQVRLNYFLTTGAIGILYKMNASISGAEVGCQGETGVACSMAAAGLTELLGGTPEQVCVAAEIGMEHNLGLTCDPVGGLVQIPCIERNAIAAVKAINAARMALRRTSQPKVSLDKVIEVMYQTGKDMNAIYRETSRGGLAIKIRCE